MFTGGASPPPPKEVLVSVVERLEDTELPGSATRVVVVVNPEPEGLIVSVCVLVPRWVE